MNECIIAKSGLLFKFKMDQNGQMIYPRNNYPSLPPALVAMWTAEAANEAEWCFKHDNSEYVM